MTYQLLFISAGHRETKIVTEIFEICFAVVKSPFVEVKRKLIAPYFF